MPRGKSADGLVIGFLGTGEMEVDPATDLIEEFINESIKPEEPAVFVFPLTSEEFSDSMGQLADMARKSKIRYEVITTADDKKRRVFTEVANGASRTYTEADVWVKMENLLTDASKSALFVLWDDKREDNLNSICFQFMDAGIPVLDLTNGLAVLGREEGAEDEEPEGEEGEGEEEEEAPETVAEAPEEPGDEEVFTRPQLEHMSHAEVKEIAVSLGLPPRKAREGMIQAILEAQETAEAPEAVPVAAVMSQSTPATTEAHEGFWGGLKEALDEFGSRLFTGLEEFSHGFISRLEGIQFNLTPEKPMDVEPEPEAEQPRRLSRQPR
jgi:hypothetical protein